MKIISIHGVSITFLQQSIQILLKNQRKIYLKQHKILNKVIQECILKIWTSSCVYSLLRLSVHQISLAISAINPSGYYTNTHKCLLLLKQIQKYKELSSQLYLPLIPYVQTIIKRKICNLLSIYQYMMLLRKLYLRNNIYA